MASLDKNLFIKFNHLTDDFTGTSTILGASQKSVKDGLDSIGDYVVSAGNGISGGGKINTNPTVQVDSTVLRTGTNPQTKSGPLTVTGNMTMNSVLINNNLELKGTLTNGTVPWTRLTNQPSVVTGDGLQGGGKFSDNLTISVDPSVLRSTRTITTGSGLQGGGDLSTNRSFSVDNTVLRTNADAQTKTGPLKIAGRVDMQDIAVVGNSNFTPDPEARLHVDGNVIVEETLLAKEDVLVESDIRIKDEIERIQNPFRILENVKGYTYHLKKDIHKRRHMGLIAQEVQETMPEVVRTNMMGTLSVAYGNIVGVLVEAVKELNSEVMKTKEEVKELKQSLAAKS